MRRLIIIGIASILLISCNNKTTKIGDNTFVRGSKVYKIVNDELVLMADLNSNTIRTFEINKPQKRDLGAASLSYIKADAEAHLVILYRGNILYYKLTITDFNDMKDSYTPGEFTIKLHDAEGFEISNIPVLSSQLTGLVDEDNKIQRFEYNGHAEISKDIYTAIDQFSVSSTVKSLR